MRRRAVGFVVTLLIAGPVNAVSAGHMPDMKDFAGGLVVHIGCGDGKLTAGLHANDHCIVHGLDADEANVAKARETVRKAGLHGAVSIDHLPGDRLPYIDNLVNLIVTDDLGKVGMDEVTRVLCPNGTAYIKGKKIVKPWPEDMDQWTHWLHGPDNNAVSTDSRVGISRNMQWIASPSWGRHHNLLPSVSAMVSAKGRIFYIIDEAPIAVKGPTDQWALVARDAFNGLMLWKRPIENWGWRKWSTIQFGGVMRFKGPDQLFRRLVAVGDTVYVTLGFNEPVVAIDGATGRTIRQYQGTENSSEILHTGKLLLLARNAGGENPGKDILAVDSETGEILWEKTGYSGITSRGDELKVFTDAYLTAGDDKVFFLNKDDVVALDMKTGQQTWKSPRPEMEKGVFGHNHFNFMNFCSLVYHDNILFLGQIYPSPTNLNRWQQKDMSLLAMDADSGKKIWEHKGMTLAHFTPPDLFVNNGLVWTMKREDVCLLGLDIRTGEIKKEFPVKDMLVGHHHRCYRNKATRRFYLAGEEGIEYIDFHSGKLVVHHWLRGACSYGIMPANGLIYLPTHACGCHSNVKLNGFFALAARPVDIPRATHDRLKKGPAFGNNADVDANPLSDWPVFKHDNMRSNHLSMDVPAELSKEWEKSIGGTLTPTVIADGKVFLAAKDRCLVCCLDATTGQMKWQVTTDGPVDTPPSFHDGRLVFGTRAGSVYALMANDGALIWRFQAAPVDLRLVAFGRLESLWPVHGSVLVIDGKAYCVAGRSMHLDSGMYVYVLDLATGEVLQQSRLTADTGNKGEVKGATLPDLLVSDGESINMRNIQFRADDIRQYKTSKGGNYLRPNDGGLLDETWPNNAFWSYGQAKGQMLVFDENTVYGIRAYGKLISKSYGQDVFTPGTKGYQLFAVDIGAGSRERGTSEDTRKTGKGKRRPKGKKTPAPSKWGRRISVRAHAMVLTDKYLFLAGGPDIVDRDDPWGAFEDRKGGVLEVRCREDGKKVTQYKLDSAPVYDGMAAAGGRIYITLRNGTVLCMSESADKWTDLFDGRSLHGWRASEHKNTWRVEEGCLVGQGPRSHLFYQGAVGNHDFRNFELEVEVCTERFADSGIFLHTAYQPSGWPANGYEIQINNTRRGSANCRETVRTGSLNAVRNIYTSCVTDGQWFRVRLSVIGGRIRVWVNDLPTVDYIEPEKPYRKKERSQRVLSHGTFALEGHDSGGCVRYRSVKIRLLPDDADPSITDRASDEGYGVKENLMDRFAGSHIPVIDYHIHLRGGMTVKKAMDRQAVTGINVGVLKNIGKGWPIETDDQLRKFLDAVKGKPVFVGLQVNDRDWMDKHSPELLKRLDYVLGDTMIMPMPDDDSKPVKLWMADQYTIDDPQAWMKRYVRHNLQVLSEPITILANPTYLPPAVKDMYDELWTDERMRRVIQAAIDNTVALEINAGSGLPHERFIRMAKRMGAKFTFGTNNFHDRPIDMTRCFQAIGRYQLTKDDMFVPTAPSVAETSS